jgi:2-polyprenyl-3-methyl-5-hydroxy-6-metoxy-1,4-benzoquinol methylase
MQDPDNINSRAIAVWEANAAFWDEYMGEGGIFQRHLVGPATERLLNIQPGETVLEIACGNGAFARRLIALGAGYVVATDGATAFLERAQARTTQNAERIEYRQVDATDQNALQALGQGRFEAVVCSMALMDISTLEPLAEALPRLLRPGGRFVFTVPHPCFNHARISKLLEEHDQAGTLVQTASIKVSGYITPVAMQGAGVFGQPQPQYYFDRPLHLLLAPFLAAGLALDGLEEPVFDPELQGKRPLSWENLKEIPPVLAVRLRAPAH